jgi:hypothetical protein
MVLSLIQAHPETWAAAVADLTHMETAALELVTFLPMRSLL